LPRNCLALRSFICKAYVSRMICCSSGVSSFASAEMVSSRLLRELSTDRDMTVANEAMSTTPVLRWPVRVDGLDRRWSCVPAPDDRIEGLNRALTVRRKLRIENIVIAHLSRNDAVRKLTGCMYILRSMLDNGNSLVSYIRPKSACSTKTKDSRYRKNTQNISSHIIRVQRNA
jgi:hypothetical protein